MHRECIFTWQTVSEWRIGAKKLQVCISGKKGQKAVWIKSHKIICIIHVSSCSHPQFVQRIHESNCMDQKQFVTGWYLEITYHNHLLRISRRINQLMLELCLPDSQYCYPSLDLFWSCHTGMFSQDSAGSSFAQTSHTCANTTLPCEPV